MMEIHNDGGPKMEREIKEIAQENFAKWAKALLTKEPGRVAELYAWDSSFLPTVSDEFKHGPDEAEVYFKHFLEKNPEGEIKEETVMPLANDTYLHTGFYNFKLGPNGNRQIVEARFTFVWRKGPGDQWKIVHHHSSVKPQH
jgi:uncharacterized protein (TIGR02246 family)